MLGMLGNPKKVASLIIAGISKDKEGKEGAGYNKEVKGTEKSETDFDMIAEDMANCVMNKDKEGLSACFKSLLSAIESRIENKGEVEESEEEEKETY